MKNNTKCVSTFQIGINYIGFMLFWSNKLTSSLKYPNTRKGYPYVMRIHNRNMPQHVYDKLELKNLYLTAQNGIVKTKGGFR